MLLTHKQNGARMLAMIMAFLLLLGSFGFSGAMGIARAEVTVETAATATPSTVAAGSKTTVEVQVTPSESTSLLVDVEIFDPSLKKIHQMFKDKVKVRAGKSTTVPFTWNVPADLPEGEYVVSVGIFGAGWSSMYKWHAGATTIKVTKGGSGEPAPTIGVPANLKTDAAVKSISLTWDQVSGATGYDLVADGTMISLTDNFYTHKELLPDTQHTYKVRAKNDNVTGDWIQEVSGKTLAEVVDGPLQITNTSATATPSVVTAGSPLSIQTNVTASQATSLLIDVEIFDPSLKRVDQLIKDNIQVNANEEKTVSFDWNVPATLPAGTYTISFGVFGAGWSGMHKWHAGAATFAVQAGTPVPTFTSSATATPSTVLPGEAVTVDAAVTATVGMDALVEINLLDPAGAKVASKEETKTFGTQQAEHVALGWTVPTDAVTGKYKVEVNVWNQDRSQSYHLNPSAGMVTVSSTQNQTMPVPDNFKAVPATTSISLTWNSVSEATAYDLEVDGTVVENVTKTIYVHDGLAADTQHKYRVRAKNDKLISSWSNELLVKTLPLAQTGKIKINVKTNDNASASYPDPNFDIYNASSA
ncbi:MAG: hypothetical protein ACM32O_04025, partial [Clostridia bacterium]